MTAFACLYESVSGQIRTGCTLRAGEAALEDLARAGEGHRREGAEALEARRGEDAVRAGARGEDAPSRPTPRSARDRARQARGEQAAPQEQRKRLRPRSSYLLSHSLRSLLFRLLIY